MAATFASRFRRVTWLALPLLAACSSKDDAEASGVGTKRKWVIGATIDRLSNDYFVKIKEGIETRAKELGLEVNALDAQGSDDKQLNQLESLIRQKVDAIIIAAVNDDVPAIEETVTRARAAGIKVVAQSQRLKTADVYVSIRQHDFGMVGGEMAGAWIREHMHGEAEVGLVSMPERPTIIERVQGLKDGVLKHAPNAKIVAEIAAPTPEKAQSNAEAALQQSPNMKVIVSFNDDNGLAAASAVEGHFGERASKAKNEYAVFGLDAIQGALDAIANPKSPYRGTVDIDPLGNGRTDVDVAVALLEGKPIANLQKTETGQPYLPVAMKPVTEKDVSAKK